MREGGEAECCFIPTTVQLHRTIGRGRRIITWPGGKSAGISSGMTSDAAHTTALSVVGWSRQDWALTLQMTAVTALRESAPFNAALVCLGRCMGPRKVHSPSSVSSLKRRGGESYLLCASLHGTTITESATSTGVYFERRKTNNVPGRGGPTPPAAATEA